MRQLQIQVRNVLIKPKIWSVDEKRNQNICGDSVVSNSFNDPMKQHYKQDELP